MKSAYLHYALIHLLRGIYVLRRWPLVWEKVDRRQAGGVMSLKRKLLEVMPQISGIKICVPERTNPALKAERRT